MTEDALRQDYARYESAEQLDTHMSRMEHRGNMVMGDTRIEALDNSLFDKLQVLDGDISPMLEPDNNAIECKSNDFRKPYDSYLYSHRTPSETWKENRVITEVC